MNCIQATMNYFDIESCDNYLRDNYAYNWCRNIMYSNPIESIVQIEDTEKVSLSKIKEDVYRNSSILLENVDLMVDYISLENTSVYEGNRDISFLEKKKETINVFEVPVIDKKYSATSYFIDVNQKYMPILVDSIELNRSKSRGNLIIGCAYMHEIGHALYQRKGRFVRNYLHFEFVPTALDLLYAYINGGEEGLSKQIKIHLFDVAESQKVLANIRCDILQWQVLNIMREKYDISQLLGYQVLEKYIEFQPQQKEEMISRLKDCLNRSIQAETFMEDYDIGFQDKDSSIKYFRKTMKRVGIR